MEWLLSLLLLLLLQDGTWGGQPSQQEDSVRTPKVFKRAIGDALSRRSSVDKNFIRFGRSGDYFHDLPNKNNANTFARVSRATKDNFMRFGRPDFEELFISPTSSSLPSQEQKIKHFLRFGRKDNFMRFGRKENFMRFGRNFIRFGRGKDNFMRFGRGDNFMRFGKSKDNFMRFGRKDNFMRFGRSHPEVLEDEGIVELTGKVPIGKFVRFGKSPKNADSFIRFGRNDPEEAEEQRVEDGSSDVDIADLDLEGDKPKNGPVVRIKRNVSTTLWDLEEPSGDRISNDSQNVESEQENSKADKKRYINSDNFETEPVNFNNDYEPIELLNEVDLPSDARNGESSLIRFG